MDTTPVTRRRRISRTDVIAIVLFVALAAAATVTYLVVRRDDRQNDHAKSLLRTAARHLESFSAQRGDVEVSSLTTGSAADAANRLDEYAPDVRWRYGSPSAQAKLGEVGFRYDRAPGAAAADRYVLETVSETGDTFLYYRNERDEVFRCRIPKPHVLGAPPHYPFWIDPTATAGSTTDDCTHTW